MLYSRFDPVAGHYDYYEAGSPLAALNDDLPVPAMPRKVAGKGHAIGLPSVECGRPIPAGATHVGTGQFAEGHIAPPAGVRLEGTSVTGSWAMDIASFIAGAAAVGAIWLMWGRK